MSWKLWILVASYPLLGIYGAYEQLELRKYLVSIGEVISGVGKAIIVLSYFLSPLPSSLILLLFLFVATWDIMDIFELGVFGKTSQEAETWSQRVLFVSMLIGYRVPVVVAAVPVAHSVLT